MKINKTYKRINLLPLTLLEIKIFNLKLSKNKSVQYYVLGSRIRSNYIHIVGIGLSLA